MCLLFRAYLFTSLTGHRPAQCECALPWQGALPQPHNQWKIESVCVWVGVCGWGGGGHCKRCYFIFEWKINFPGDLPYYAYVSIIRVFSGLFIDVNFKFLSCNCQRNAFVPTGWKIGTQCLLAVFKEKRKLEILFQLFYISQKASIWDRLSREHDVEDQIWRSEYQRTRTAGSKARGNAGNF